MKINEDLSENNNFYASDTKTDYVLLKIVLDVNNIPYLIKHHQIGIDKYQVRFYVQELNHELVDREKVLLIERIMQKDPDVIAIYNYESSHCPVPI